MVRNLGYNNISGVLANGMEMLYHCKKSHKSLLTIYISQILIQ